MKKLTEMTNRELFSVLTGSDIIGQAYLQKIVRAYLRHAKAVNRVEEADLQTMVREYMDGVYGEPELREDL